MVAEVRDGLLYVFMPPSRGAGPLRRPDRPGARRGGEDRLPGRHRRLRTAAGPAADVDDDHPRPRCHRGQHRAHRQFRRAEPAARNPLRASQIGPAVHGVVPVRRQPQRHRRRQPHHPGRHHPEGLTATAPARPVGVAADLLAAAPVVVLPVRRAVRRHHVAGAAGGRGPRRGALRTRDRVRRNRPTHFAFRGRLAETVGHRPGAAASAHRHHRQHASRRVLHRQALQPGQPARPAGPAGAARLRDAAASADGDGAVAAGAVAGGLVLGRTAAGSADPARLRTCTDDTCCRTS